MADKTSPSFPSANPAPDPAKVPAPAKSPASAPAPAAKVKAPEEPKREVPSYTQKELDDAYIKGKEDAARELGKQTKRAARPLTEERIAQLYADFSRMRGYIGDFASESDGLQRAFRHVVEEAFKEGKRNV